MKIYSLDVLLSLFGTILLFHVWFSLLLLDLHAGLAGAEKVVWYSHFLKYFPQFVVIHTVKGFNLVDEAEIDVFLELSWFFYDPANVGNLISGSSVFFKSSSNMWKFLVHILLKPGLENFEHYFASMWKTAIVW